MFEMLNTFLDKLIAFINIGLNLIHITTQYVRLISKFAQRNDFCEILILG